MENKDAHSEMSTQKYNLIATRVVQLCGKYGKFNVYQEWFENEVNVLPGLGYSLDTLAKTFGYMNVSDVMADLFEDMLSERFDIVGDL